MDNGIFGTCPDGSNNPVAAPRALDPALVLCVIDDLNEMVQGGVNVIPAAVPRAPLEIAYLNALRLAVELRRILVEREPGNRVATTDDDVPVIYGVFNNHAMAKGIEGLGRRRVSPQEEIMRDVLDPLATFAKAVTPEIRNGDVWESRFSDSRIKVLNAHPEAPHDGKVFVCLLVFGGERYWSTEGGQLEYWEPQQFADYAVVSRNPSANACAEPELGDIRSHGVYGDPLILVCKTKGDGSGLEGEETQASALSPVVRTGSGWAFGRPSPLRVHGLDYAVGSVHTEGNGWSTKDVIVSTHFVRRGPAPELAPEEIQHPTTGQWMAAFDNLDASVGPVEWSEDFTRRLLEFIDLVTRAAPPAGDASGGTHCAKLLLELWRDDARPDGKVHAAAFDIVYKKSPVDILRLCQENLAWPVDKWHDNGTYRRANENFVYVLWAELRRLVTEPSETP